MTSPVLAIENLVVRYPEAERPTLDGLNLTLAAGDRLALVGPSGCGKSTVARAVLQLLPPGSQCSGSLLLAGQNPSQMARPSPNCPAHCPNWCPLYTVAKGWEPTMSALPAKACRWSSSNRWEGQPSSVRNVSLRAAQRGAATGEGCKCVKNRVPNWVRRCVQSSNG